MGQRRVRVSGCNARITVFYPEFSGASGEVFGLKGTVVPERPLPPRDAPLVVAIGAEPENIVRIDVKQDREQGAAGFPARPAPPVSQ